MHVMNLLLAASIFIVFACIVSSHTCDGVRQASYSALLVASVACVGVGKHIACDFAGLPRESDIHWAA